MFDTLESAQEEILRLQGALTEMETARDTLSSENETLKADNERIRKTNQMYFERLCMQDSSSSGVNKEEDEEPVSCEDFARTLNI